MEPVGIKIIGKESKNGRRAIKIDFSKIEEANEVIKTPRNVLKDKQIFVIAVLPPSK